MSRASKQMDVFLQPGEYFVGDTNCRIRTLLGSCVSITLWHPVRKIGGMSHFLLASRRGGRTVELDGRYGDEALSLLLRDLQRAGAEINRCEAKIFGGGNMFPRVIKPSSQQVGKNNGEAARRLLQAHGIPIISESLYGVGHRQVVFDVANGHVWSRQIKPIETRALPTGKTAGRIKCKTTGAIA